jgi:hypothetical protein
MNPFVNPNKRDFLLPNGCQDLIDVLNLTKSEPVISPFIFRKLIQVILFQALHDEATELVIGVAQPKALPIKYKVKNSWHDMVPVPPRYRLGIIYEILQMAKMPTGQFPNEGIWDITSGSVRSKWKVKMTSMDAECVLVRIFD